MAIDPDPYGCDISQAFRLPFNKYAGRPPGAEQSTTVADRAAQLK
jgi:hypothetical protein